MFRFITFIAIGLLCFIVQSCEGDKKASVYKIGRIWYYDVLIQDSVGGIIDSFQLKMKTRGSSISEKAIRPITVEYEYIKDGQVFKHETTGIVDNSNEISIHPPRNSYFDIAEIAPFPRMSKPIGLGFTSTSDFSIQKASYIDRSNDKSIDLTGKMFKQEISLTDSSFISFANEEIKCYITKGKNLNHLKEVGQFSGTFYFNEKYGFVKLEYSTPWHTIITANLTKVEY